jgi:hypothetical protein
VCGQFFFSRSGLLTARNTTIPEDRPTDTLKIFCQWPPYQENVQSLSDSVILERTAGAAGSNEPSDSGYFSGPSIMNGSSSPDTQEIGAAYTMSQSMQPTVTFTALLNNEAHTNDETFSVAMNDTVLFSMR